MKAVDIQPAREGVVNAIVFGISPDAEVDSGSWTNGTMMSVVKRLQLVESELKKWQQGGVTEGLLRKNDGAIKVGRGCEIAVEGTTERLNSAQSAIDVLKKVREAAGAQDDENIIAVINRLKQKVDTLASDLAAVCAVRDTERGLMVKAQSQAHDLAFKFDSIRADLYATRDELKLFKEYNNALFELAKEFIPACGTKSGALWETMMTRGRELSERCRGKVIDERDNQWADALEKVTGVRHTDMAAAANRVRLVIKEARVKLLFNVSNQCSPDCAAFGLWLRKRAQALQESEDDNLPWELPVVRAGRAPSTPDNAPLAPAPSEKTVLDNLQAMMKEPHYKGVFNFKGDRDIIVTSDWYNRLKTLLGINVTSGEIKKNP